MYTMLTSLFNVDPLTANFYIVRLGFTGEYIYCFIFALKHRLWVLSEAVLTCTHDLRFEQKQEEKYPKLSTENCHFYSYENPSLLHWRIEVWFTIYYMKAFPINNICL